MDILPGKVPRLPRLQASTNTPLDWAAHFLGEHNANNIHQYLPYAHQGYTYLSTMRSYILALIEQVSRKPDLATIALLLVILFISLKLLNMLWQTFIFWFNMARKLAFWGGLVALGLWMYTRGFEGVQEDVQYWIQVWGQERDHFRERERTARVANQGGTGWDGGGRRSAARCVVLRWSLGQRGGREGGAHDDKDLYGIGTGLTISDGALAKTDRVSIAVGLWRLLQR